MGKKNEKANLQLTLEVEVRDKYGKLISKHRQVSKSLLKNFALALRGLMFGNARNQSVTLKDVGGVSRSYPNLAMGDTDILNVNAPAGNDVYGLWAGSGTIPVSRDDFALATKIAHGSATGQLMYGAVTVEAPDGAPPTTTFRVIRTFTNNTTAPITVNEIGLVFHEYRVGTPADVYYMIARDVLPTPQSIPAGATLTVRYTFSVTA